MPLEAKESKLSSSGNRLGFGMFIAPQQHPQQNPTRALHRHLETIELIERLHFEEVWVGEHHSGGYELIGSNEVFLAAAAERTQRLRLATGVVSLPYHHPYMVAERAVLLDHLCQGRLILGVGPGSLPQDAAMFGIHMADTRRMMSESLEAIHHLLTRDEPLTMKTDWFTLEDAELQLRPYSHPGLPLAMTAMESPFGPSLAGKYGAGLVSIGATTEAGFAALANHWSVVEEQAALHGQTVDRAHWRVVGWLHVAETREQAIREVAYGLPRYLYYVGQVSGRDFAWIPAVENDTGSPPGVEDLAAFMNDTHIGCIGTPDDAIDYITRLRDKSGGFGTLLVFSHDWATPEATHRSLELISREVMPTFQNSTTRLIKSMHRSAATRTTAVQEQRDSIEAAKQQYTGNIGKTT